MNDAATLSAALAATNPADPQPSSLPRQLVDGIEVYNICRLLDGIWPDWTSRYLTDDLTYEVQCAAVRAWAKRHGSHLYSADREEFSVYAAAREAREKGLKRVVVEDLS
jgi:hypothetical protein